MKLGFVIDNRKCIGCHACTTACKSEHQVPVGVNRTWVKQVEKGVFPDTRRLFSVMRCNHCTDAPCVTICPTEALNTREDGIVDFDKDRCIGCKSCMQACPYDALYIDPETHTAAKCNYCAHRIDVGLEPACVNVCPEHAIISGDMDDPNTEIARLLAREPVKTRKPEKATKPNLFYIDADDASLIPSATAESNATLWGSQSLGVGHFAKEAEKLAFSNADIIAEAMKISGAYVADDGSEVKASKSIALLMNKGDAHRVYDTPGKGILWGWEVSGYVWTKAIAAGVFLVPFMAWLFIGIDIDTEVLLTVVGVGLVFLSLTGVLLVMDLDQPKRFFYVLLRPHFSSWLVKGGYTITAYGALLTIIAGLYWLELTSFLPVVFYITGFIAVLLAIYTAFLFAQAKGRDFWQSPTLAIHMLVHAVMAGAAVFMLAGDFLGLGADWSRFLVITMLVAISVNLFTMLMELTMTHPTKDAKSVVHMILEGRYKNKFWLGIILLGNIIPLFLLGWGGDGYTMTAIASILVLIGIYITEHVWIEAPQRISLR